jgi:hypothetical protein
MGIALRQEQDAMSIGHPFAVVFATFISFRGVGELPWILSTYPGEPQVTLAAIRRGIGHPNQDSPAVGCETGIAHGLESSQLFVAGKIRGTSARRLRPGWEKRKDQDQGKQSDSDKTGHLKRVPM